MSIQRQSWSEAAAELNRVGQPYAIVTILATAGSAPREGGTKMVVTEEQSCDTIGGGQLEFLLTARAREMLATGHDCQEIKQYSLSAKAKQCCGGAVTTLVECFAARYTPLAVFGAGHVAHALMRILSDLPFRVRWIDSRAEMFDGYAMPNNIETCLTSKPEMEIDRLSDDSYILVLTHDHTLDFQLCRQLLEQDRWGFIGLIGSDNKARRFRARLKREGITEDQLSQLHCPVGLSEVTGKLPMEIAVSIAAQLISAYGCDTNKPKPLTWKQMKSFLNSEHKDEPHELE